MSSHVIFPLSLSVNRQFSASVQSHPISFRHEAFNVVHMMEERVAGSSSTQPRSRCGRWIYLCDIISRYSFFMRHQHLDSINHSSPSLAATHETSTLQPPLTSLTHSFTHRCPYTIAFRQYWFRFSPHSFTYDLNCMSESFGWLVGLLRGAQVACPIKCVEDKLSVSVFASTSIKYSCESVRESCLWCITIGEANWKWKLMMANIFYLFLSLSLSPFISRFFPDNYRKSFYRRTRDH